MSDESVVIRCESCNQKIWVPEAHYGQAGRCPKCKTALAGVMPAEFNRKAGRARFSLARLAIACCWAYLIRLVLIAAAIHLLTEARAVNSVLLFAPRWVFALPLLVVTPLSLFSWRWAAPSVLIAVPVNLLLIAGFVVRWGESDAVGSPQSLRIVTCNTGGGQLSAASFKRYLDSCRPDIVVLEEWNEHARRPVFDESDVKWTGVQSGGISVASRLPIETNPGLPFGHFELSGTAGVFEVTASSGSFRLLGVHLPTARDGISAVISWRLRGLPILRANAESRERAAATARRFVPADKLSLIAAGDFNLPSERSILRNDWSDLTDAFRVAGKGFGHTKHTNWHGVRIDQIRFDDAWTYSFCEVGPYVGSDHRPVFAVLEPAMSRSSGQ